MSENFKNLQNDIKEFETVIRKLSMGINGSGIAWRDSQYAALEGKVSMLAASSKGVIQAARSCENAMKRFDNIISEVR